jgi:c-di-GMP-binding flagellar brake protein YcgR
MASNSPPAEARPQEYEFEQLNLQVGGRIQLITHRTLKPVQHFSTVIGWIKDEYMIVKLPLENGVPVAIREGEKLTIRVFSGVNVCAFSTIVQRVFDRPLFYLHVAFPTHIQGTSLRTAMRVRVDIPAQLNCPKVGNVDVFLANLSVSGALIESQQPLHTGSNAKVGLSFTLLAPPDDRQVQVNTSALVRNTNVAKPATQDKPEVYTYGVQFVGLDPSHYTLLQNLTYEALIADRQKIV